MLVASGRPWVMENVVGSPLRNAVTLCGTMFGLGADAMELQRHRLFEASFMLGQPVCDHAASEVIGIYGGHIRNRRRREGSQDRGVQDPTISQGRKAMGIDWMTLGELSQAIPPAYTNWIGRQLRAYMEVAA